MEPRDSSLPTVLFPKDPFYIEIKSCDGLLAPQGACVYHRHSYPGGLSFLMDLEVGMQEHHFSICVRETAGINVMTPPRLGVLPFIGLRSFQQGRPELALDADCCLPYRSRWVLCSQNLLEAASILLFLLPTWSGLWMRPVRRTNPLSEAAHQVDADFGRWVAGNDIESDGLRIEASGMSPTCFSPDWYTFTSAGVPG